MKKGFIIFSLFLLVVIASIGIYWFVFNKNKPNELQHNINTIPTNTILLTQTPNKENIIPTLSTTSNVVTGKVLIYTITDKTMTVQFIAESTKGNITQMMVWTDANPTKEWQKFSTLLTLPISDNVYVKYSDNLNNKSQIYSDTTIPSNGPPPQP